VECKNREQSSHRRPERGKGEGGWGKKRTGSALWLFSLFILLPLTVSSQMVGFAYAHKPLVFSGPAQIGNNHNNNLQSALIISNHKISWALFQQLDTRNKILFYKFNVKAGDPFYAQLIIPKIRNPDHNDFHPRIALMGNGISISILTDTRLASVVSTGVYSNDSNNSLSSALENTIPVALSILELEYEKQHPNASTDANDDIFYEPFTQTSYWKAQEFRAIIPNDGGYFLAVYVNDAKELGADSKFVLAVGETEDFGPLDFVTTLPSAWIQTKLFFGDYLSLVAAFLIILIAAIMNVAFLLIRRRHRSAEKGPWQQ
jgi:hypothetical protein